MATSELLTLQIVADQPSISPGALARTLSLSPVTSTVILQKLEGRGLIEKVKSPSDKRKIEVRLTQAGKSEIEGAPSSLQAEFMAGFGKLPEWEQHLIAAVLGRVTTLLNADKIDASPILDVGPLT